MEGKQLRLSWKSGLAVFGGTIIIALLFLYFGKLELARPTVFSIGAVGIAVAVKWKLKNRTWFWAAIVMIAALHIPLILFVPWTTRWIPAIVMTPFLIADIAIILALIKLLEKLIDKSSPGTVGAGSPN